MLNNQIINKNIKAISNNFNYYKKRKVKNPKQNLNKSK